MGTVQATRVPWQGRGYAGEAAQAMVGWAPDQGMQEVVAYIHPKHHASAAVAARAGLLPTEIDEGERVWRTSLRP